MLPTLETVTTDSALYFQLEMTAAAERKKGDPTFRLLLVKMDDQKPTPERCNQFLLESWRANDQVRSVIRLPAALIERKINAWIAGALFL